MSPAGGRAAASTVPRSEAGLTQHPEAGTQVAGPGTRDPKPETRNPRPFFYGWLIVGACFLVNFSESGIGGPVVSVFLVPMSQEYGWSRGLISAAVTVGSLGAGLISPAVGSLVDRVGARWVLLGCLTGMTAATVSLGLVQHVAQLFASLGVGRALLMGGSSIGAQVAVSNWFIRQRGRAMGYSLLGTRIGATVLPLVALLLIESLGWRLAWIGLGIGLFVLAAIPTALVIRRRPEDMGLLPDGVRDPPQARPGAPPEPAFPLREALRTRTLWLLSVASLCHSLAGPALHLHQVPFFLDRGLTPVEAVTSLSLFGLFSAVGTLLWGYLAERVPPRPLLTALLLVNSLSMIGLLQVGSVTGATLFAFTYGMAFGGTRTIPTLLWADYYGRTSLGAIRGFTAPFTLVSHGLGPLVAGLVFDYTGTYHAAFLLFAASYGLSALLTSQARPPVRHPQP